MKNNSINTYTMAEAKEALSNAVESYLVKDENGNYVLPEFNKLPISLLGPPGVGKTEVVEQVANNLGLGFVSFSLTHHTRNSVLGLPVINDREDGDIGGKYTTYTMSEILAKVYDEVNAGHTEGILLLDEFPCMSSTIMPVMLAFLQKKNIGTHFLPSGWVIVLCGNPKEYNKSSVDFDKATMDRIRTIEVAWDPEVFINYAKEQNFHKQIINYLELHPDRIYKVNDDELVTCRGWENLSRELKIYESINAVVDYKMVHQFIKSIPIATAFFNYYIENMNIEPTDVFNILEGNLHSDLIEKYNDCDSSTRLQLTQILQKKLTDKSDEPFQTITQIEHLRILFDVIRKQGPFSKNFAPITPLETLNHLIDNYGDTTLLQYNTPKPANVAPMFNPSFGAPAPVNMPYKGLVLDLPQGFWEDREVINGLKKLVRSMCEDLERKVEYKTLTDPTKIAEFQYKSFKNFLNAKSKELKKQWKTVTKNIDNTFIFLDQLNEGSTYAERFYYFIGHCPNMQRAIVEAESTEYMKRLETIYGETPA